MRGFSDVLPTQHPAQASNRIRMARLDDKHFAEMVDRQVAKATANPEAKGPWKNLGVAGMKTRVGDWQTGEDGTRSRVVEGLENEAPAAA